MQYKDLYAHAYYIAQNHVSLDSKKKNAKTALHFPTARNQFRAHCSGKNHLIFPMCGSTILPIICCKAVSFSNPTSVFEGPVFPMTFWPIFWLRKKRRLHAWIPSFPRSFAWSFQQTAHPQASKGAGRFRAADWMGIWLLRPFIGCERMLFFQRMVTTPWN